MAGTWKMTPEEFNEFADEMPVKAPSFSFTTKPPNLVADAIAAEKIEKFLDDVSANAKINKAHHQWTMKPIKSMFVEDAPPAFMVPDEPVLSVGSVGTLMPNGDSLTIMPTFVDNFAFHASGPGESALPLPEPEPPLFLGKPAPEDVVLAVDGWKVCVKQLTGPVRPPRIEDLAQGVAWLREHSVDSCMYGDNLMGVDKPGYVDVELGAPSSTLIAFYRIEHLHTWVPFRNTWYVRRAKMETPPAESPHPLIAHVTYHPEAAGMGKKCRRCLQFKGVYLEDMYERWYCLRCYPIHYSSSIANLPVPNFPPWFLRKDGDWGWRWATLQEAVKFAEEWDSLVTPGEYSEVREGQFPDKYCPLDGRLMMRPWSVRSDGSLACVRRGASFAATIISEDGEFATGCGVCGVGGDDGESDLYARTAADKEGEQRKVGHFHGNCWTWFLRSGAAEAHDVRELACGHLIFGAYQYDPEAGSYDCKRCGYHILPRLDMMCPDCHPAPDGHLKQLCYPCALLDGRRLRSINTAGVLADFDVIAALADFYTLSELRQVAPGDADVSTLYEARVGEIADQLRRYTIMATGGELRHFSGCRRSILIVGYDVKMTKCVPGDAVYCSSIEAAGCTDTTGLHVHHPAKEVRGAINSKPFPPSRKARDGTTPMEFNPNLHWHEWAGTGPVVVNGEKFDALYAGDDDRIALFNDHIEALERTAMWSHYWTLYEQRGVELLQRCRDLFLTGRWRESMGGYWWGVAADLVWQYERGDLSRGLFVDHIFGLHHNGGSLLNKIYILNDLDLLLDLKRNCDSAGSLLPWVSKPVMLQYVRVAQEVVDDKDMRDYAEAIVRTPRAFEARNNTRFLAALKEVAGDTKEQTEIHGYSDEEVEPDE